MTEYLYASPSEKAAFAGAPDDATHAIKLDGQKRWAKKNEADEMMFYAVKGNDIVWRTMELHECEEYELVAERTPIQQPSLDWNNAPADAEFILKSRKTGHPAWGKSQTDMSIMGRFDNEPEWFPFPLNHWDIVSRRVPVTTSTPHKPAPYEPTLLEAHSGGWGFKPGQQFKGYVVAYHADWVWFVVDGVPEPTTTRLDKVTFTKPLTQEEEARAKAVKELADLISYHIRRNPIDEKDIANDIISAGYRKAESASHL